MSHPASCSGCTSLGCTKQPNDFRFTYWPLIGPLIWNSRMAVATENDHINVKYRVQFSGFSHHLHVNGHLFEYRVWGINHCLSSLLGAVNWLTQTPTTLPADGILQRMFTCEWRGDWGHGAYSSPRRSGNTGIMTVRCVPTLVETGWLPDFHFNPIAMAIYTNIHSVREDES